MLVMMMRIRKQNKLRADALMRFKRRIKGKEENGEEGRCCVHVYIYTYVHGQGRSMGKEWKREKVMGRGLA